MNRKRKLTEEEIEDILDFIKPNINIPEKTAQSIVEKTKQDFRIQLQNIVIYPSLIPTLKSQIENTYVSSLIPAGKCVGIITAQSIGERQTQANLNVFHRAGSSDKQPVVSKFAELLNATSKPKSPSYFIYFNEGNTSVPELRKTIGNSLVQLSLKQITKHSEICFNKEHEKWYNAFFIMNGEMDTIFTDCISLTIDINKLYEYNLTLKKISQFLCKEYADLYCIYSPDCIGKLDIFVKTDSIQLPERKMAFVNENNLKEIFMEEVFQPTIENLMICGISGIKNIYFLQDGKQWYIETENSKGYESSGFKGIKEKPADSAKRFRQVLAHSKVNMTKTLSNNVWDIYFTFGIEAVRQYMIDEFSKIMDGINLCHVMLLVDKMTFKGSISSVSRYSMRSADSGVFSKASFEETLSNFLDAGVYGQEEPIKGPSAAIICGKRAPIGTGLCNLEVDVEKLLTIKEEEEEE